MAAVMRNKSCYVKIAPKKSGAILNTSKYKYSAYTLLRTFGIVQNRCAVVIDTSI